MPDYLHKRRKDERTEHGMTVMPHLRKLKYLLPSSQLETYSIRKIILPTPPGPSASSTGNQSPSNVDSQAYTEVELAPEDGINLDSQVQPPTSKLYTKRVKNGSGADADRIVSYLDGVMDAVTRKYLRRMTFFIYLDESDPDNIVEAYTFDFTYSEDGPHLAVTASTMDSKSGKKGKEGLRKVGTSRLDKTAAGSSTAITDNAQVTQETIYKSLKQMMKDLSSACREMTDLPTKRYLDFKLDYVESTPHDYQPPGFKDAGHAVLRMGTTSVYQEPERWAIGSVQTEGTKIALRTASVVYNLPEPRINDIQEVAVQGTWSGKRLTANEQKRKLQNIQEEEEEEVMGQAAKRKTGWALHEEEEDMRVKFKHELPRDDEEPEHPDRVLIYAKRGNERAVDLDLETSKPQSSRRRRSTALPETLRHGDNSIRGETQYLAYMDKGLGSPGPLEVEDDIDLDGTQPQESAADPIDIILTSKSYLDIVNAGPPSTSNPKGDRTKRSEKYDAGSANDSGSATTTTLNDSTDSQVQSDSHTDPESPEYNPKKETFQGLRSLSRNNSKDLRSKQKAVTKRSAAPQTKKATSKPRSRLKRTSSATQFGTSHRASAHTSIAEAVKSKKKRAGASKKQAAAPSKKSNEKPRVATKSAPALRKSAAKSAQHESADQIDEQDEADDEDGDNFDCHCGDPEEDEQHDAIGLHCETCKRWYHGVCVGVLLKRKAPTGDYQCVLCRASLSKPFAPAEDRDALQASARELAFQRKVLRYARHGNEIAGETALAEVFDVTVTEAKLCLMTLQDEGFLAATDNASRTRRDSSKRPLVYIDNTATRKLFHSYFTPMGRRENELFNLAIPEDELIPASQLPMSQQAPQSTPHPRTQSSQAPRTTLFDTVPSQMDPIHEDTESDFASAVGQSSKYYGFDILKRAGGDTHDTIDNESTVWPSAGPSSRRKGKARETDQVEDIGTFGDALSGQRPASNNIVAQQQGARMSSRIDTGFQGPLVPDDDATNWEGSQADT